MGQVWNEQDRTHENFKSTVAYLRFLRAKIVINLKKICFSNAKIPELCDQASDKNTTAMLEKY